MIIALHALRSECVNTLTSARHNVTALTNLVLTVRVAISIAMRPIGAVSSNMDAVKACLETVSLARRLVGAQLRAMRLALATSIVNHAFAVRYTRTVLTIRGEDRSASRKRKRHDSKCVVLHFFR